jgi:hypothetical protein
VFSWPERSQGIGFGREAGSRVGVECPALLVPARVLECGSDHGGKNCGALGVFFRWGSPPPQKLRPERQVGLYHALLLHGDAICYDTYSDVVVHRVGGAPPPSRWACRKRWALSPLSLG